MADGSGYEEAQRRIAEWSGGQLDLSDLGLTTIPPEIGELTTLTALYLNENRLTVLPPEIGRLTALKTLSLRENVLTKLPPEIGKLTALRELYLYRNVLARLPHEIGGLTALTTLYLQRNRLMELPAELGSLSSITTMNLSANRLAELPTEIRRLTTLQRLDLSANYLTELPPGIGDLTALSELHLSGNEIKALPPEIGKLTALTRLSLSRGLLTALPPEIGDLAVLAELDLNGNLLTGIPREACRLASLTKLDLSENQLAALPPQIGGLTALTELDLNKNRLTTLPDEFGSLAGLATLNLSENSLRALPTTIDGFTALIKLNLSANHLTELPPEITSLSTLTHLDLNDNNLGVLPSGVGSLASLAFLDLGGNRLTTLPTEIGCLSALEVLLLYRNRLTALPAEIGGLTSLTTLNLNANQLTLLPTEIGGLTRLTSLHLSRNLLTALPCEMGGLTRLNVLVLIGNPLPREVLALEAHLSGLLAYLREQAAQKTRDLREVKLVFVGPPDSGKTCLLRKLQGKPFLKDSQTTYGFDIGREPLVVGTEENAILANCWDFGGQKKYEITHQFFFSEQSVFIVVWEPREDTTALRRWLATIQNRAGEKAPILVVASYRDEPGHTDSLNRAEYQKNWPGIRGFFWITNLDSVSGDHPHPKEAAKAIRATTKELVRLRAAIHRAAEGQIIRDFPDPRRQAREKIRSRKGLAIFLDEYQMATSEFLDGAQAGSLLRQMDGIGDLVYHAGSEDDKSLIVLQPQWLGKAIGFALDDRLAPPGNGMISHEVLSRIWDQHAEEESYEPGHYPYFLWLMERFDLAHRIDEKTDLIPKLVQEERPLLLWQPDEDNQNDRQVTYQWVFEGDVPSGLVPILTAMLHGWRGPDAGKQPNWSQGMFLVTPAHQSAFMQLDDRILTVAARAYYPAWFARGLREAVEAQIKKVWPGLKYSLQVPCPTCLVKDSRPVFGFPVDFLEEQDEYARVPCMKCRSAYKARDLTAGYRLDKEQREMLDLLVHSEEANREMAEMLNTLLFKAEDHPNRVLLSAAEGKFGDSGYEAYALSIYCDHPEHLQPVKTYPVRVPKAWLKKIKTCAHWTGVVAKGVGLVVPGMHLIGSAMGVALSDEVPKDLRDVSDKLFGADLEIDEMAVLPEMREGGAYRRVLEHLLEQVDPSRSWGGLEKARTGTRVQWFCQDHKDRPPVMS